MSKDVILKPRVSEKTYALNEAGKAWDDHPRLQRHHGQKTFKEFGCQQKSFFWPQ
jgi:ribosomal protein L23